MNGRKWRWEAVEWAKCICIGPTTAREPAFSFAAKKMELSDPASASGIDVPFYTDSWTHQLNKLYFGENSPFNKVECREEGCEEAFESLLDVVVHSLNEHPVEFLVKRNNFDVLAFPSGQPVAGEQGSSSQATGSSGKACRKPTSGSGGEDGVAAKRPNALLPSPPRPPTSGAGEEGQTEGWRSREEGSTPAHAQRLLSVVGSGPGTKPADSEQYALAILPFSEFEAMRCSHNEEWCVEFPSCLGRWCPQRHGDCHSSTPCPKEEFCPFDHPEYEKTCDICPLRKSPPAERPHYVSCRRWKRKACRYRHAACRQGPDCTFTHGMCTKTRCGWRYGEAESCYYEHADRAYLCEQCAPKKQ